MVERGMDILGLKLEMPRIDVGSSAPLEGMSTLRHPLLQQAILFFQANFRGELLPASGPVKVTTYGDESEEIDAEAEMLARRCSLERADYLFEVAHCVHRGPAEAEVLQMLVGEILAAKSAGIDPRQPA